MRGRIFRVSSRLNDSLLNSKMGSKNTKKLIIAHVKLNSQERQVLQNDFGA